MENRLRCLSSSGIVGTLLSRIRAVFESETMLDRLLAELDESARSVLDVLADCVDDAIARMLEAEAFVLGFDSLCDSLFMSWVDWAFPMASSFRYIKAASGLDVGKHGLQQQILPWPLRYEWGKRWRKHEQQSRVRSRKSQLGQKERGQKMESTYRLQLRCRSTTFQMMYAGFKM